VWTRQKEIGAGSGERGAENGDERRWSLRHLTLALSPIEAERGGRERRIAAVDGVDQGRHFHEVGARAGDEEEFHLTKPEMLRAEKLICGAVSLIRFGGRFL
jgi:hypothetical protein